MALLHDRCEIISGDITGHRLGLQTEVYDQLASKTTHIIHCAAATKFNMPEERAAAINLSGTRRMVEFAQRSKVLGGLKKFSHVSTAFVCGDREGLIREKLYEDNISFSNNYEKSKWETERFLKTLNKDLPLTIFRPSIIVGDSQTGRINDFNVLYMPLRLILSGRLKLLPCRRNIPLDIVPLDYVARVIAHITFNNKRQDSSIYHVTAGSGNEATVEQVVSGAVEHLLDYYPGLSSVRVHYMSKAAAALNFLMRIKPASRTQSILEAYLPYFTRERHFDCSNTATAVGNAVTFPSLESYYDKLMKYFYEAEMCRYLKAAA